MVSQFCLQAHPGRTDKKGGHHGPDGYHYHGGAELPTIGDNVDFLKLEKEAKNLTEQERIDLYEEHKKGFGLAMLLNVVPGFGLGSSVQGDSTGFLNGFFYDLLSLVIVGAGWSTHLFDSSDMREFGNYFMIAGGICFGLSKIAQLIFPPVYASKYNKKLLQALSLAKVSINILPSFEENKQITLAVCFRI